MTCMCNNDMLHQPTERTKTWNHQQWNNCSTFNDSLLLMFWKTVDFMIRIQFVPIVINSQGIKLNIIQLSPWKIMNHDHINNEHVKTHLSVISARITFSIGNRYKLISENRNGVLGLLDHISIASQFQYRNVNLMLINMWNIAHPNNFEYMTFNFFERWTDTNRGKKQ